MTRAATPGEGTDWSLVALGLGLATFAAFQLFKLPPVLPILLERYHYDRTLAGGFMSVYAVTGLLLSLPLGRLIARRGAAAPVLAALAIVAFANLISLAAPESGWLMLFARGLEGLSFTVLAIAGPFIANSRTAPRDRGIIIGMVSAWIPAGQILSTAAASALPDWQTLWLLALGVTAGVGLWFWAVRRSGRLPEPNPTAPAAEEGKVQGRRRPATDWHWILPLWIGAAIFFLWSGQYFAAMTWLPQFLVETQGLDVSQAALGTLLPVSVLLGFNLVAGWLIGRGVPLALLLSTALACQAATWWLLPQAGSQGAALGLVAMVIYGLGAGFCPTCLFALPERLAREGRPQPGAFAIIMMGRNLGVLLGPLVMAQAVTLSGGWDVASPIFGGSTLFALALAVALGLGLRRLR